MTAATETRELRMDELKVGQIVALEDERGGQATVVVVDPAKSLFRRLRADALDPSDATSHIHILAGIDDGSPHQTLRRHGRLNIRYSSGREVITLQILHAWVDNGWPVF
jgi:hypothetical protein